MVGHHTKYTDKEMTLLLDLIQQFNPSGTSRGEAWERVVDAYNTATNSNRTYKALVSKFSSLASSQVHVQGQGERVRGQRAQRREGGMRWR